MIAKLQMYLNDTSSHPAAKAEVALFLYGKVYPLETARLDIGHMPFKDMVEFVGSWCRRAQESRIILDICQDIAAELVYGAYWNCNPVQVQIRSEAPGMASIHLIFTGNVSADIEIATIQQEQVVDWMLWAKGVTDVPDKDKGLLTAACDRAFGDFTTNVKEAVSLLPLETAQTSGGENGRFDSSVVSYPGRGPWGDNQYRGNCSGYIIKGFLETYHPLNRREALFVDPMMGGGTSRDVAREMGIPFVGLDLKTGFDVLSMSIQQALGGRKAATVFTHPAYRGMIKYSADARDMSNAPDTATFIQQMQLMGLNIYEALENGGFYAVLMGFWRHEGVYEPLASILAFPGLMPGLLTDIIVKVQHNTTSERNHYSGHFVPIMHEEMVVFKKGGPMNYALLDFADQFSRMLNQVHTQTWRNVVRAAMLEYPDRPMSPKEVFELVMQMGAQKTSSNANVDAKVRQVLKTYPKDFERVGRGKYALAN